MSTSIEKSVIREKLVDIFNEVLNEKIQLKEISMPEYLQHRRIDSLMILQIIVRIEQIFNVAIDDDEAAIAIFSSFEKIVDFIEKSSENTIYYTSNV